MQHRGGPENASEGSSKRLGLYGRKDPSGKYRSDEPSGGAGGMLGVAGPRPKDPSVRRDPSRGKQASSHREGAEGRGGGWAVVRWRLGGSRAGRGLGCVCTWFLIISVSEWVVAAGQGRARGLGGWGTWFLS